MNLHYALVAQRAGHRCEYCHAPEAVFNLPFEVEHIIPVVHGGADSESNWALSCRSCNLFKGAGQDGTDPQTGRKVALFHPRLHQWEDHFVLDEATGQVNGLTSVGRATIARLRMNGPAQLSARREWGRLRLFPGS
jgi:HNH endonuclease